MSEQFLCLKTFLCSAKNLLQIMFFERENDDSFLCLLEREVNRRRVEVSFIFYTYIKIFRES